MSDLDIDDRRVFFMAKYALLVTKQKADKITKPYGMEDNRKIVNEFFEESKKRTVFIFLGPSGVFQFQGNWPGQHKLKGCYFVKKKEGRIPMDCKMGNELHFGDMSTAPIEQLSLLVDEVSCLPQLLGLNVPSVS